MVQRSTPVLTSSRTLGWYEDSALRATTAATRKRRPMVAAKFLRASRVTFWKMSLMANSDQMATQISTVCRSVEKYRVK